MPASSRRAFLQRSLALGIGAPSLVSVLAACTGGEGSRPDNASVPARPAGATRRFTGQIVVATLDNPPDEAKKALARAYQKQQPGVKIVWQTTEHDPIRLRQLAFRPARSVECRSRHRVGKQCAAVPRLRRPGRVPRADQPLHRTRVGGRLQLRALPRAQRRGRTHGHGYRRSASVLVLQQGHLRPGRDRTTDHVERSWSRPAPSSGRPARCRSPRRSTASFQSGSRRSTSISTTTAGWRRSASSPVTGTGTPSSTTGSSSTPENPLLHASYTYSPQRFYRALKDKDKTVRFDTPAVAEVIANLARVFPKYAIADFILAKDRYQPFLLGKTAMLVDGAWSLSAAAPGPAGDDTRTRRAARRRRPPRQALRVGRVRLPGDERPAGAVEGPARRRGRPAPTCAPSTRAPPGPRW